MPLRHSSPWRGYAAAGSSTAAEALSSPEAAAIALEDDGVLIEVLHARLCPAHRRHGESRFIQEISGRVLSTGKKVREFRPGAYVGFLGEIVPCGRCSACSAGHRESCRNAGRVCDSTCRGHDGRCRNRIITQECNLVKFNEDEAASEQFSPPLRNARAVPTAPVPRPGDGQRRRIRRLPQSYPQTPLPVGMNRVSPTRKSVFFQTSPPFPERTSEKGMDVHLFGTILHFKLPGLHVYYPGMKKRSSFSEYNSEFSEQGAGLLDGEKYRRNPRRAIRGLPV
ncbi:MAG: alcohol dehydrogenase catalytic domain-containing protein [Lentisphaeria bacterium]|nr:MAG: alcohol dehydrogenase catalytic domain-containing protein [Lentisphaeria bacterium]